MNTNLLAVVTTPSIYQVSLDLHLYWCSIDYTNIVRFTRISDYRRICPWSHRPIVSVLSYWLLVQTNSAIMSSQSPDLLSCLINCFRSGFYHYHYWNVRAVEPCLSPTHIFKSCPLFFSLKICALIFRNSNTSFAFAQTIMVWFLQPLYAPCSCFFLGAYYPVSYVYLCQIFDYLTSCSFQQ